jgi:hypothetical protein
MRVFAIFAATLFVSLLSGCATKKDLVPTGGSRADGTVNLSYEYGGIEQPQIDIAQGTAAATSAANHGVIRVPKHSAVSFARVRLKPVRMHTLERDDDLSVLRQAIGS